MMVLGIACKRRDTLTDWINEHLILPPDVVIGTRGFRISPTQVISFVSEVRRAMGLQFTTLIVLDRKNWSDGEIAILQSRVTG